MILILHILDFVNPKHEKFQFNWIISFRDFIYLMNFLYANFYCCWLFNDGHVLELWPETVAVRKWMIYDDHVITGD